MIYMKYDPNNNLPTHEAIIHKQRNKEVKALAIFVCVTNEYKYNIIFHRERYSNGTPDWEILGFNMCNG